MHLIATFQIDLIHRKIIAEMLPLGSFQSKLDQSVRN